MQNLVIDIGNTRTKIAIFEKGKMVISFAIDSFSKKDFDELIADYKTIRCAIVSTVRNDSQQLINYLKEKLEFVIELDHTTPLPIQNCYETPKTLGKDRIAAAVGANKKYPNRNILIIDAGTAITYDFVNHKNDYLGGFITPGLNMRFKALHQFTDKLPLLKATSPEYFQGNNTNSSIMGGVQLGLEGEIDRIIHHYSSAVDELIIILTGGDTNYFEKLLKNYKFVALEITLLGLNTILESNYIRLSENR